MAPYPFQPSAFTLHLSLARHVLALPRAPARRMALETLGARPVCGVEPTDEAASQKVPRAEYEQCASA